MTNPDIIIQRISSLANIPDDEKINHWIIASLQQQHESCQERREITIRIVDEDEAQQLNQNWRGKDYATNVLSFPYEEDAVINENESHLLGDIVICAAVVRDEAIEQNKMLEAHWAHLLVHGCLHLLGYDHINEDEAEEMEGLECLILEKLGYPDPYREEKT